MLVLCSLLVVQGAYDDHPTLPMKRVPEAQAIALLETVVGISVRDRDALSGKAVDHVKRALTILRKRRGGTKRKAEKSVDT